MPPHKVNLFYKMVAKRYGFRALRSEVCRGNSKGDRRTKKHAWKLTTRCHIVNRSACHNHCNLLYSSHRHGGCHRGCHSHSPGHCSVFVVAMAVSMVPFMVIIIVVTAASLQGHGCQRSKKKCSLTVPLVIWRSFNWDAMPPCIFFSKSITMVHSIPTSNATLL